ncbi:polyphosphate kinase 1 [Roseibacillus ishigakijimensis]|uniref:Polyphosphate kinase n=1 Tax=Roseibacillus ishigakijimensis TaxID=454146 RepID=A0A934RTS9_9BACT|nr:polyphosphate kinase 1 [Roseibacillus ishigakijimensis]MBK1834366.1 polyphosphate kinase 1 [Roseibacillus ishigakijimensis]
MPDQFINRELSWLEFNQRVLDQACRPDLPILERVKFLAITASNLDEFFQVRVGGLTMAKRAGSTSRDLTGLTATQQLAKIRSRCQEMSKEQYRIFNDEIAPMLAEKGLVHLNPKDLTPEERVGVDDYFKSFIFPMLTPLALESSQHAIALPSLQIVIAARLTSEEETRYAFVPIPVNIPRFISVPREEGEGFVMLEDLIRFHLGDLFPRETITGTALFRLTRNTDIAVDEEDASDLIDEMEEVLSARRFSATVRLQLRTGAPRDITKLIQELTGTASPQLYRVPGPLALTEFMQLAFRPGFDHLRAKKWTPQPSPAVGPSTCIFDAIASNDILLSHPFESFEPVVRLVQEAAKDPNVLSIKQVLYRTAEDSAIINALIRAAENGKQVTVLIELKARFDEARNLHRAEELQRAGVQVVYGVKGLKTHAKITLVARNEGGRLRRYVHLGTGNYNESTARLYTDISYLTCRPEYAADASLFFNAVTGRSKLVRLQKLASAPTMLKQRVLELIEGEIARAKQGHKALIMGKMNSLQHPEVISALYRASRAGVEIKLNVRGICCLKPGNRKDAKNITVVSIIDRFLEHARVFYFHRGGDPEVAISSADWMVRNLDSRVELMIPIEDRSCKRQLIRILEAAFKDNTNASLILPDGTSKPVTPAKGERPFRLQEHLYRNAVKAARNHARQKATTFEPHLPND